MVLVLVEVVVVEVVVLVEVVQPHTASGRGGEGDEALRYVIFLDCCARCVTCNDTTTIITAIDIVLLLLSLSQLSTALSSPIIANSLSAALLKTVVPVLVI